MRLKALVVCLLAPLFILMPKPAGASTQDFVFDSFTADYYLSTNQAKTPLLKVDETLVARFPDFDQNHGILRAIPEQYQGHTLSLKVISVADETGQPYHYTTSRDNHNLVLKIGDADKYVLGVHTYKISYEMRNVINYQNGHDEFYWDINGDQWPQVFGQVVAKVHLTGGLATGLQDQKVCYVGANGSRDGQCNISSQSNGSETVVTATANNVEPYQTLTTVTAFNKGLFMPGPEIAHEQLVRKINTVLALVGGFLPPALTFWIMFKRWREFGDDPKGRA